MKLFEFMYSEMNILIGEFFNEINYISDRFPPRMSASDSQKDFVR